VVDTTATTPVAQTVSPEETVPQPSTEEPGEALPPGYVTYSDQGWLLVNWVMSPLSIQPESPRSGIQVDVSANIYIADIPMSFVRVELSVNGSVMESRQFALWYDDVHDFSFAFTPDAPGIYDVVVRASMIENEDYVNLTGEDLSLYSSAKVTVTP
jgi:hypothetical protein